MAQCQGDLVRDHLGERATADQGHRVVGAPVGGQARVVDRDDPRVVEPGRERGLADQLGDGDLVTRDGELERDGAIEAGVVDGSDLAHAPAPDQAAVDVALVLRGREGVESIAGELGLRLRGIAEPERGAAEGSSELGPGFARPGVRRLRFGLR